MLAMFFIGGGGSFVFNFTSVLVQYNNDMINYNNWQ